MLDVRKIGDSFELYFGGANKWYFVFVCSIPGKLFCIWLLEAYWFAYSIYAYRICSSNMDIRDADLILRCIWYLQASERLSRCGWTGFEVRLMCVCHEFAQDVETDLLRQALALYSNPEFSDLRGVRGEFGLGSRCVWVGSGMILLRMLKRTYCAKPWPSIAI